MQNSDPSGHITLKQILITVLVLGSLAAIGPWLYVHYTTLPGPTLKHNPRYYIEPDDGKYQVYQQAIDVISRAAANASSGANGGNLYSSAAQDLQQSENELRSATYTQDQESEFFRVNLNNNPGSNPWGISDFAPNPKIVLLPERFFTQTLDEYERALILLHESRHLIYKNEDEPSAHAYHWKLRCAIGWTERYAGLPLWNEFEPVAQKFFNIGDSNFNFPNTVCPNANYKP